jgi:hypothetical protein
MNEDKIAEIRAWVERRQVARTADCALSHFAENGVVIYGVPLGDSEVDTLRAAFAVRADDYGPGSTSGIIWEMLKRGKK